MMDEKLAGMLTMNYHIKQVYSTFSILQTYKATSTRMATWSFVVTVPTFGTRVNEEVRIAPPATYTKR